jgi:hypothetical protein
MYSSLRDLSILSVFENFILAWRRLADTISQCAEARIGFSAVMTRASKGMDKRGNAAQHVPLGNAPELASSPTSGVLSLSMTRCSHWNASILERPRQLNPPCRSSGQSTK